MISVLQCFVLHNIGILVPDLGKIWPQKVKKISNQNPKSWWKMDLNPKSLFNERLQIQNPKPDFEIFRILNPQGCKSCPSLLLVVENSTVSVFNFPQLSYELWEAFGSRGDSISNSPLCRPWGIRISNPPLWNENRLYSAILLRESQAL